MILYLITGTKSWEIRWKLLYIPAKLILAVIKEIYNIYIFYQLYLNSN